MDIKSRRCAPCYSRHKTNQIQQEEVMISFLGQAQKGFIRANIKCFLPTADQYAHRAASATNNRFQPIVGARVSTAGTTSRPISHATIKTKTDTEKLSALDASLRKTIDTLLKYDPKGRNATKQVRDFNIAIDSLAKSLLVSTDEHGIKEKGNQIRPQSAREAGNLANQLLSNLEHFAYERGIVYLTPTVVTYNSVMHVWAKAAYHVGGWAAAQAELILETMIRNRLWTNAEDSRKFPNPDVISFNTVIDAYAKSGESDAGSNAERILKRMEAWSAGSTVHQNRQITILPNTHSFSSVIEAHVRSGGQDSKKRKQAAYRAQAILDEMLSLHNYHLKDDSSRTKKERCIIPMPNTVVFHSVLGAYANSGLGSTAAVRAEQILETMLHMEEARPTTKTFSLVMNCWAKSKSTSAPARVEDLLRRMQTLFLKPNKVTLTSLIHTWVTSNSSRSAEKANALLDQMLQNYRESGDRECAPSVITFNVVLDAWAKSSTHPPNVAIDRIWNILQQMKDLSKALNDTTIQPNIISYNAALHVLSRMGGEEALSRARTVLQEIESNDQIHPDICTYNAILSCLVKSGKADAHEVVSSLLQSLEERAALRESPNIFPDRYSYTILIDAISKSNTPNQAELAVQTLKKMMELHKLGRDDMNPDVYTFTSVITACARTPGKRTCKKEALNYALRYFNQMQYPPLDLEPNAATYGAMLHAISALSSSISERERLLEGLFRQCSEKGYLNQEFLDAFRNSVSDKLCRKLFGGSLGAMGKVQLHEMNPLWSSRDKTSVRRRSTTKE